ncbi:MAG TPA: ATP-binding protein [Tepidisphaeraceae bacterium]|jgi:Amt family ammonium transporter|nr:ATP-binding protein [Tepidisphaeraceae bacterium]
MNDTPFTIEHDQAVAMLEQLAGLSGLSRSREGNDRSRNGASDGKSHGWQPELRFRSLIEKLPVVTFMAGLDGSRQDFYVSPQIETLLGFTQTEWMDNPILWYRQLHPDDREKWVEEFSRTCATGSQFRAEYRLIARDGHIVWVQGDCQIIRDEHGQPIFFQGIAVDITHLKRAAEVEEEKLKAEAASRAKSEFLARMSHEIRTPLNGVVGMIDLLSATGLSEIQQRYTKLAREAADSLLAVINDVLDFSKIEAGKVEVEAIEFDLHKVMEDLTELLAPSASKKNLALACLLRPEVPHRLIGDPNRIRQVLTNLVNNALKFTAAGYVGMRAELQRREGQHTFIRVQVEDTGIGIPADRLDRLFKSFSQVDSSTTRKFGGTGLGLAISKHLVELMGGEIGIESEVGRGTTFWFTLKLGAIAGAAADIGPAETLRNVRVLAVESDATYRRLLAEQLRGRFSAESEIVGVENAINLLRKANEAKNPFAVALIPYRSNGRSQLNNAIREDPTLRHTKLIAVLDIDDRADAEAISQAGFVAELHRPFLQSRLLDAITTATVRRTTTAKSGRAGSGATHESLAGLHLLVAEDNEMNQFVTQETLRRAGCTCDIVGDGSLAIEAVEKRRYDGVLMDCQMPGVDGLEATRRIREREVAGGAKRRIPVIALTAEAIHGDRERCLEAGMDGYVTKPINAADLFATIGALVKDKKEAISAAEISSPRSAASEKTSSLPGAAPAPPIAAAESPIDVAALLTRCMSDADFAVKTLEKFQKRAIDDAGLLRAGVGAADLDGARRLAHNLKAVAAHVGAAPLRAIAFEIEQAGIRNDLQFMQEQLARLEDEARRCALYVPEAIIKLGAMSKAKGTPN